MYSDASSNKRCNVFKSLKSRLPVSIYSSHTQPEPEAILTGAAHEFYISYELEMKKQMHI